MFEPERRLRNLKIPKAVADYQCSHCGEPCRDASISSDQDTFCCTGCRSVYQVLRSRGMCDYYNVNGASGVSQHGAQRDLSAYAILSDNDVAARYINFVSGPVTHIRFSLPGIHCASCVWLLEQLHRLDQGILSSRVDLLRKTIEIEFNNRQTTLASIAILLSSVGYEPLLCHDARDAHSQDIQRKAVRSLYLRLGIAGFAAGNVMMIGIATYVAGNQGLGHTLSTMFAVLSIGLCIPVYFYSAQPWLVSAVGSLRRRAVNLDVPVAIGITTLFIRSIYDIVTASSEGFLDSFAGLVFFLLIGKLFQQKAFDAVSFDRTVRSFFPLSVRRIVRGVEEVVPTDAIAVGDILIIRNGEVIPADAVLISEMGYVDYAFITGESVPNECTSGSIIYAGGRVVGGALRLTATRAVSQSYLASLWERSASRTPRVRYMNFSDRFGAWFSVGAISIAVLSALFWLPNVYMAMNVFTAVLIIACPCALTLAAPITLGTAMGALGRMGIYIKNIGVLRELATLNILAFDKTGTLTSTTYDHVYSGRALSRHEHDAVIAVAAHSTHPVSRSIAQGTVPESLVSLVEEIVGEGLRGTYFCLDVVIGSAKYVAGVTGSEISMQDGTFVGINGEVVGKYVLQSCLREGTAAMIAALEAQGTRTILITGDSDRDREVLRPLFQDDAMVFRATPEDKVRIVEQLQQENRRVLMVGDGLNDVSAMAMANVSIAVTNESSMLAPASDVVMQARQLTHLPLMLLYARWLNNIIMTSLVFTMVYNVAGLTLAATGRLTPVLTAIMMPLSSLLVVAISFAGARVYARRFV